MKPLGRARPSPERWIHGVSQSARRRQTAHHQHAEESLMELWEGRAQRERRIRWVKVEDREEGGGTRRREEVFVKET